MSQTYVYCEHSIEEMLAALPSPVVEPPLTEDSNYCLVSWEEKDGQKYSVDVRISADRNVIRVDNGIKEGHNNGQKSNILEDAGICMTYWD